MVGGLEGMNAAFAKLVFREAMRMPRAVHGNGEVVQGNKRSNERIWKH
jgi:hypothetical protein